MNLDYFKELFLQRQASIMKSSAARATEELDNEGDETDQVQNMMLKSISDKLTDRDKQSLQIISNCLKKINDSSFGLCEECEEEISEKRLMALPYASLCISCAEGQEIRIKKGLFSKIED